MLNVVKEDGISTRGNEMMTRQELCLAILEREMIVGTTNVFQSSLYAIVMDYLGRLNETESEYAKERGGCLFSYLDTETKVYSSLSFRELLDLLPE